MSEINWNIESVDAFPCDNVCEARPGGFKLFTEAGSDTIAGMNIQLPGPILATIYFTPNAEHPRPVWQWDGNREKPTVSPSIRTTGGRGSLGWHGFLRAGRLESC